MKPISWIYWNCQWFPEFPFYEFTVTYNKHRSTVVFLHRCLRSVLNVSAFPLFFLQIVHDREQNLISNGVLCLIYQCTFLLHKLPTSPQRAWDRPTRSPRGQAGVSCCVGWSLPSFRPPTEWPWTLSVASCWTLCDHRYVVFSIWLVIFYCCLQFIF